MDKSTNRSETRAVLLYHRMGRPKLSSLVAGQYVAPRLFESQLGFLESRGWSAEPLAGVCEPNHPEVNGWAGRFAVTFDDGYLSVYEHAYPVLARRGIPATVYVVVDSIGDINEWDRRAGDQEERMMTSAQIRELADHGFEIGSHTLTHPRLTELDDVRLEREVADSRRKLEDLIGRKVLSFSYPYGNYDGRVLAAAAAAGYARAVTTRLGIVNLTTNPLEIPRVNVRWNTIGPLLMRKIGRAEKASNAEPAANTGLRG